MLDLTFEALCRDPVGVTSRIGAFLGLPMPEAAATFLRGFTRPEKIADHRERRPERVRAVEDRIGATLRRFGYLDAVRTAAAAPPIDGAS